MALNIRTETRWVGWHIGKPEPTISHEILYVCADGDELEKIRAEITGIPMSTKRVVTWFGDDARFIVANLNY